MARFTEEEKMLRRIDKRFSKGVVEYGLIEDGDKILIGLSGGKDSLALVELLARRARVYKPRFSVVAVHVVMKNIPYQSDVDYLREYVESWGVPFVLFETEFDATTDTRKSPCFLYHFPDRQWRLPRRNALDDLIVFLGRKTEDPGTVFDDQNDEHRHDAHDERNRECRVKIHRQKSPSLRLMSITTARVLIPRGHTRRHLPHNMHLFICS